MRGLKRKKAPLFICSSNPNESQRISVTRLTFTLRQIERGFALRHDSISDTKWTKMQLSSIIIFLVRVLLEDPRSSLVGAEQSGKEEVLAILGPGSGTSSTPERMKRVGIQEGKSNESRELMRNQDVLLKDLVEKTLKYYGDGIKKRNKQDGSQVEETKPVKNGAESLEFRNPSAKKDQRKTRRFTHSPSRNLSEMVTSIARSMEMNDYRDPETEELKEKKEELLNNNDDKGNKDKVYLVKRNESSQLVNELLNQLGNLVNLSIQTTSNNHRNRKGFHHIDDTEPETMSFYGKAYGSHELGQESGYRSSEELEHLHSRQRFFKGLPAYSGESESRECICQAKEKKRAKPKVKRSKAKKKFQFEEEATLKPYTKEVDSTKRDKRDGHVQVHNVTRKTDFGARLVSVTHSGSSGGSRVKRSDRQRLRRIKAEGVKNAVETRDWEGTSVPQTDSHDKGNQFWDLAQNRNNSRDVTLGDLEKTIKEMMRPQSPKKSRLLMKLDFSLSKATGSKLVAFHILTVASQIGNPNPNSAFGEIKSKKSNSIVYGGSVHQNGRNVSTSITNGKRSRTQKRTDRSFDDIPENWMNNGNQDLPSVYYTPFPSLYDSIKRYGLQYDSSPLTNSRSAIKLGGSLLNGARTPSAIGSVYVGSGRRSELAENSNDNLDQLKDQSDEALRTTTSLDSHSSPPSGTSLVSERDSLDPSLYRRRTRVNPYYDEYNLKPSDELLSSKTKRLRRRRLNKDSTAHTVYPYGSSHSRYKASSEENPLHYTYNPSETPKCAKEIEETFCEEDSEYPVEALQAEIDEDATLLDLMTPESKDSIETLIDGVPKKEDEKFNWRHYFSHRIKDYGVNASLIKTDSKERMTYVLKPDYFKDGGYICPSIVSYVRPRRAKTASGLWKVVINLRERYKGREYKQSIRIERCTQPMRECSYVSSFYNSQCVQKYVNHRLLAWSTERGIHTDIFQLPVACSCFFKGKGL